MPTNNFFTNSEWQSIPFLTSAIQVATCRSNLIVTFNNKLFHNFCHGKKKLLQDVWSCSIIINIDAQGLMCLLTLHQQQKPHFHAPKLQYPNRSERLFYPLTRIGFVIRIIPLHLRNRTCGKRMAVMLVVCHCQPWRFHAGTPKSMTVKNLLQFSKACPQLSACVWCWLNAQSGGGALATECSQNDCHS